MRLLNRAIFGQATNNIVLPALEDLEVKLNTLSEKDRAEIIKNLSDDALTQEKYMAEQFIGNATNALTIIKNKMAEIESKIILKQQELAVTPTMETYGTEIKKCCFLCMGHCDIQTTAQRPNQKIAEINSEIGVLNTERLNYLSLADRGMAIFNKLNNYLDRLNEEIRDRHSIIAQIPGGDLISEAFKAIPIPAVVKPYLPIVAVAAIAGGIILYVRKKKK